MRRICAIDGCGRYCKGHGLCELHLKRLKRHGDVGPVSTVLTKRGEPREWLLAHVNYNGVDCLIWPYAKMTNGYPLTWWNNKKAGGHRVMCELANGPPPSPEHEAAHSCGNGRNSCISPVHLNWKTPMENSAEKYAHGTMTMGSASPFAKLTEYDIPIIRKMFETKSDVEIAKKFGVSDSAIYLIRKGHNWRHVL
jgi:hypothetical protein